jgi:hypothetical protein
VPESITCPSCGRTSHHPKDIEEGYCGFCHDWTQPDPPVNVRISYLDGSEDPVELVYLGQDASGVHQWEAAPTAPLLSRYATLKADTIPAHTSIRFRANLG